MEIFACTFIIKLQYVKRTNESSIKKGGSTTFQAILKSSRNFIIASGNSRPSLMNDTAWFNEKFEINSDLLYNPETKAYLQSIITLQIKATSKFSNTAFSQSFDLAEIAEKKIVPERQYNFSGGLIAGIELCCTEKQSKGYKPLRKREKSEQKSTKEQSINSFLMIEKVSFAAQGEKENGHDTPQFHESTVKEIELEQQIDKEPLVLEVDLGTQLNALKDQLHKEIQQHEQTKSKLKTVKQLLEAEYNINRQQKSMIFRLQKQTQSQKQLCNALQAQLIESENECTRLSATINQKQSEIIELFTFIEQYKEKLANVDKKLDRIPVLERAKAQLEWENGTLKKEAENLKIMLNKLYLTESEMKNEIQHLKSENSRLKAFKDKADSQLEKVLKREKQNATLIAKLTEDNDLIRKETAKWRSQFADEAQRKDEQINHLQQHYTQLFKRYQQLIKDRQGSPAVVSKEMFETSVRNYEKKIEQHEQKESKFREQLEIIEQEIANMQALLEQKQENEEILLQHIKKLQKDIEQYAITDNWWAAILDKSQEPAYNNHADPNEQKAKLLSKNQQLVQLLQKNSKVILQGQKLKLELATLKKQNEQVLQKQLVLLDQHKQLKQKIGSLYKQNKKLQDKNAKLTKQNELLNKKNLWLEDEITQSKAAEKDARQDYEIISYQLYKIQSAKDIKERTQNEKSSHFLSVINQNSEEQLLSSHHLIRDSSIKQKTKSDSDKNFDPEIFQQLLKVLQQRTVHWQEINSHLKSVEAKGQSSDNHLEELKKLLKKIGLSTSKIKSALVRSGNKQYVRQWQSAVSSLSNALQAVISRH